MSLEVFVLAMCLGGYECNKTPQAYYLQNKDLQEIVKNTEKRAKQLAGPIVVNYVVPYGVAIGMIGTGQTARVTISKRISLEGNAKEGRIGIGWTWTY